LKASYKLLKTYNRHKSDQRYMYTQCTVHKKTHFIIRRSSAQEYFVSTNIKAIKATESAKITQKN